MRITLLIPTYNNGATICDVVRRSVAVWPNVMVVNDGSTDDTLAQLASLRAELPFELVSYDSNRGKGGAMKAGFRRAQALGFTHVLTLDGDGQHYPEDAHLLIDVAQREPHAIIVGSRSLAGQEMSAGSRFANNFSNFWFMLQTLRRLPDTQTGFRLYPLRETGGLRVLTSRYESELTLLVFSAWRGTPLIPVPVRVYYPSREERVSHFRPCQDFLRITLLNTLLCLLSLIYGYPRMLCHYMCHLFTPSSRSSVES